MYKSLDFEIKFIQYTFVYCYINMDIKPVITHLLLSGFEITQLEKATWTDEGLFIAVFGKTGLERLCLNVVKIFNEYGWNVQVIDYLEDGESVEFWIQKEEFTPTHYTKNSPPPSPIM